MTEIEQKKIFTKNLNKYIDNSRKTQLEIANAIDVSPQTFNTWVKGIAIPRMGKIQKLADYFHINKSDLIEEHPSPLDGLTNIIYPSAYPVPILGEICAGNGILCEENYNGSFYIDRTVKADFALSIRGDSMREANILDGGLAFIKQDYNYEDGKIYAVRIEDSCEAVLKKITIQGDNIILSPCNSSSEYQILFKKLEDVTILGECVGTYHNV